MERKWAALRPLWKMEEARLRSVRQRHAVARARAEHALAVEREALLQEVAWHQALQAVAGLEEEDDWLPPGEP